MKITIGLLLLSTKALMLMGHVGVGADAAGEEGVVPIF
jgi:hypothetical protein